MNNFMYEKECIAFKTIRRNTKKMSFTELKALYNHLSRKMVTEDIFNKPIPWRRQLIITIKLLYITIEDYDINNKKWYNNKVYRFIRSMIYIISMDKYKEFDMWLRYIE